jgi:ketosteroid isomerase-like protein
VSEEANVALVQKAFDAFGRGDVQTILDLSTSDSEFHCPGPAIVPYAGLKRGRTEIKDAFDTILATQKNVRLSIERMIAQGDDVVAIGEYSTEVIPTGKSVKSPIVIAFQIQNGKISRHLVMGDTAAMADAYTAASAAAR